MAVSSLRKYGVVDDRWTLVDKITLFRGVIDLHGREQKINARNAKQLRQMQYKTIKDLETEVDSMRRTLENIIAGDRLMLRTTLQHQRDVLLSYQKHMPHEAHEYLDYLTFSKSKRIDQILHQKANKAEVLKNLQLEKAQIQDNLEAIRVDYAQKFKEQVIQNKISTANIKQKTAARFKEAYERMLTMLKKDALVFERVLMELKSDQHTECRCVVRTSRMGQQACEDIAEYRKQYKSLEKCIIANMKIRETALKEMRNEVANLQYECRVLTREENDEDKNRVEATASELALPLELKHLETLMKKMQDLTLVSTFGDIFPRIEEQMKNKEQLLKHVEQQFVLYDKLSEMRQDADVEIASLRHTLTETSDQFVKDKLDALNEEKKEEELKEQFYEDIAVKGKMIIYITVSLQTMYTMLNSIREPTDEIMEEHVESEEQEGIEVVKEESEESIISLPRENPLEILQQLGRKLQKLIDHATEALDEEELEYARVLYQQNISGKLSKLESAGEQEEETQFMLAYEAYDPNVVTREMVKGRSQQIVEQNEKPTYEA